MISRVDHIVILVKELEAAVRDYTALGFTVVPGGEHTGGATHNALVAFADGSYLELIAFKRQAPEHRWWRFAALGEGIIDFALLPGAIETDIAAIHQRGLPFIGPEPGGRLRPDGQEIRWQTGTPATPDLPFFCADVTPRELRVPSGSAWEHANGVIGIAEVTVAVHDLAESVQHYRALLGVEPQVGQDAVFALGSTNIRLVEAASLSDFNPARGDGPRALTLVSATASARLDPALTHGARLELRQVQV